MPTRNILDLNTYAVPESFIMNNLFSAIRTILGGKHRIASLSVFEIIALLIIIAFFIAMINL